MSRRTVIASHYLTAAAVYFVTTALLLVIALPWGDPAAGEADGAMASAVGAALMVGSLLAWQIPFTVRFGSRGGIFLLLFVGGVGALIGWFTMDAHDERTSWIVTPATWLSAHPGSAVLAGAAVVVAQWLVSFVVSAAIFERKEL